jgi:hypothetical protein
MFFKRAEWHEPRVSVRQASKYVFPFIKPSTIHSWITAKILDPVEYVPPPAGRGHGCKLSRSDLVVVAILHCMFSMGARFGDLIVEGEKASSETIEFEEIPGWKKPERRPMQSYLEELNFKVHVRYRPVRLYKSSLFGEEFGFGDGASLGTWAMVNFFPSARLNQFTRELGSMEAFEFTSFINIRFWEHIITKRVLAIR